jgi:hypothetical protein
MSAGAYRDSRFAMYACGVSVNDMAACRAVFDCAFAQAIAEAIVRGRTVVAVEVDHA